MKYLQFVFGRSSQECESIACGEITCGLVVLNINICLQLYSHTQCATVFLFNEIKIHSFLHCLKSLILFDL